MAISLNLRRKLPIPILHPNITTVHLFSSSSNTNPNEDSPPHPQDPPQSPMSNYFSQVKASLKNQSPSPPRRQPFLSHSTDPPSQAASLQEIRKNLSQYRILTSPSPPDATRSTPTPAQPPISFQDIYQKRNQAVGSGNNNNPVSFEGIRDSLKNLKGGRQIRKDPFSLKELKVDFTIKPSIQKSSVVADSEIVRRMPQASFSVGEKGPRVVTNELIKIYKYEELGERLRRLRPANAKPGQNWFSFSELNERLIKLREIDERESNQNLRGVKFGDVRESLQKLKLGDEEAAERRKKSTIQLQNLSFLGGTPSYMLSPPKEVLVEKYFHPDNMSSADKLKLELKKIRDEFKMSESDCGSSRVQVAQLTVKIKHLSTTLHKKDKHSRKGLQEMVVRRKKLLKYLRRTDWDSYCFCLSNLGLRDNPDYKN